MVGRKQLGSGQCHPDVPRVPALQHFLLIESIMGDGRAQDVPVGWCLRLRSLLYQPPLVPCSEQQSLFSGVMMLCMVCMFFGFLDLLLLTSARCSLLGSGLWVSLLLLYLQHRKWLLRAQVKG